jgi:dienelactone hydrolase
MFARFAKSSVIPGVIFGMLLTSFAPFALAQTSGTADKSSALAVTTVSVQDQRLNITVGDRGFALAARIFRPSGDGPFPLVVINHGIPVSMAEAARATLGFTNAAQWFAQQGTIVVVTLRPGFGDSQGPYLEASGESCANRDYVRDGLRTALVEAAIVESAAALPGVDANRIVVVGHSAGGFGAIALGDAPPHGVVGIISFAGGRGGDAHEHICSGAQRLIDATGVLGKANRVPQLWLYAANDHFFAPELAHAMAQAYQAGSGPNIRFIDLPAFGDDGHMTFPRADPAVWAPSVSAFLAQVTKRTSESR